MNMDKLDWSIILIITAFCIATVIIIAGMDQEQSCKELSLMDYNNITVTVNRDTTQYIQDSADTVTVIAC